MSGRDIDNHGDWATGTGHEGHINHADVADIPGDTDALPLLRLTKVGADQIGRIVIARRAHSSPAQFVHWLEAEDGTPGGNSALATHAGASGPATNNVVRYTPPDTSSNPVVTIGIPSSAFPYQKGLFRVWGRFYNNSGFGGTKYYPKLLWGSGALENANAEGDALLAYTSMYVWRDLGLARYPGKQIAGSEAYDLDFQIRLRAVTAQDNCDVDCILIMPVEDSLAMWSSTNPPAGSAGHYWQFNTEETPAFVGYYNSSDARQYMVADYNLNVSSLALRPDAENRLFFRLTDIINGDDIADSAKVSIKYRPRGLHFRGSDL